MEESVAYSRGAVDLVDDEAVGSGVGAQHGLHLRRRLHLRLEDVRAPVVTATTRTGTSRLIRNKYA